MARLARATRFIGAWAFYLAGSTVCGMFDHEWSGGMHTPMYRVYNRCMTLSERIQGDGPGPWYLLSEGPS